MKLRFLVAFWESIKAKTSMRELRGPTLQNDFPVNSRPVLRLEPEK